MILFQWLLIYYGFFKCIPWRKIYQKKKSQTGEKAYQMNFNVKNQVRLSQNLNRKWPIFLEDILLLSKRLRRQEQFNVSEGKYDIAARRANSITQKCFLRYSNYKSRHRTYKETKSTNKFVLPCRHRFFKQKVWQREKNLNLNKKFTPNYHICWYKNIHQSI